MRAKLQKLASKGLRIRCYGVKSGCLMVSLKRLVLSATKKLRIGIFYNKQLKRCMLLCEIKAKETKKKQFNLVFRIRSAKLCQEIAACTLEDCWVILHLGPAL